MIVRSVQDVVGTLREVHTPDWVSRRVLLRDDGMGFSLHETIVRPGAEIEMQYRHHQEAVFCTSGSGEIVDHTDGRTYAIRAGTVYALDGHERHTLRAHTELKLVCVFNPPCVANEVHDESGAYPVLG